MGYKMCPRCGRKMRKERVRILATGRLGYRLYCPNCEPIRLGIK